MLETSRLRHRPSRALAITACGSILLAGLAGCRPALAPVRTSTPAAPTSAPLPPLPTPWQQVRRVRVIAAHKVPARALAIGADGQHLATGSARAGKLWELPLGREIIAVKENNSFDAIAFSPDGLTIATGDYFGQISLFEMSDGREITAFAAHENVITRLAYSPDGRYLASSSIDRSIRIWDTETRALEQALTLEDPRGGEVLAIAYSPDGKYLASGNFDGNLWLWDIATGTRVRGYVGHRSPVEALAIDPQGKILVSGSLDETIKIWDLQTGLLQNTLRGHGTGISGLAISDDGTTIASSSLDKTVRLWDLRTGQEIATLEGPAGFRRVGFVPGRSLLIGTAEDGTLWFWEAGVEAARPQE